MYRITRGSIKHNGKTYGPGDPVPELSDEEIAGLLADKMIEEVKTQASVVIDDDDNESIESAMQKLIEKNQQLEEQNRDLQSKINAETVNDTHKDDSEEGSDETDNNDSDKNQDLDSDDVKVNFNLDDYVSEKKTEEPQKAHKAHNKKEVK